jgi:hypothetical protein
MQQRQLHHVDSRGFELLEQMLHLLIQFFLLLVAPLDIEDELEFKSETFDGAAALNRI